MSAFMMGNNVYREMLGFLDNLPDEESRKYRRALGKESQSNKEVIQQMQQKNAENIVYLYGEGEKDSNNFVKVERPLGKISDLQMGAYLNSWLYQTEDTMGAEWVNRMQKNIQSLPIDQAQVQIALDRGQVKWDKTDQDAVNEVDARAFMLADSTYQDMLGFLDRLPDGESERYRSALGGQEGDSNKDVIQQMQRKNSDSVLKQYRDVMTEDMTEEKSLSPTSPLSSTTDLETHANEKSFYMPVEYSLGKIDNLQMGAYLQNWLYQSEAAMSKDEFAQAQNNIQSLPIDQHQVQKALDEGKIRWDRIRDLPSDQYKDRQVPEKDQKLGDTFKLSKEILQSAFNSPEQLAKYVDKGTKLQHFDSRQQAELIAQGQSRGTLATIDRLEKNYISYKNETPVATIHGSDGNLKPVFDVTSFTKKQYLYQGKPVRSTAAQVAKGRLLQNTIKNYKRYSHEDKSDALDNFYKENHRVFKPNGEKEHDLQVVKNLLAEHIAKKQMGLLKSDTLPTLPKGLAPDLLHDISNFQAQRDVMTDILRQSRIITTSVQRGIDQKIEKQNHSQDKTAVNQSSQNMVTTAELGQRVLKADNRTNYKNIGWVENRVTHASRLLGYGRSNSILMMHDDPQGVNFATQKFYEKRNIVPDFSQLKGVSVMLPSKGADKSAPLEFVYGKMYSAEEIMRQDKELGKKALSTVRGRHASSGKAYSDRMAAINTVLPSVDQEQTIQDRIARYMVKSYIGIEHAPFKFSGREREQITSLKEPEIELRKFTIAATTLANKWRKEVDNVLTKVPKRDNQISNRKSQPGQEKTR